MARAFDSILIRVTALREAVLFSFHALLFAACYVSAYLVRFDFTIPADFRPTFLGSLPVVVGTQLLAGAFFGFYRGWWRYVGLTDVLRIVGGLTVALGILLSSWYGGTLVGAEPRFVRSPRGVLLIDWAFAMLAIFGARLVIRLGRDRFRPQRHRAAQKRVLIIGAGDAGETLAREIEHRPQLGMKVVGFVDDQRAKWGSHIRGIRVYGPTAPIGELADRLAADEALIAIPSAPGERIREIIRDLCTSNVPFKTIPGIDQLVSGKVHVSQLRPVHVEDLMRRRRIELPGDPVRAMFRGKRVLITGAGGTIGSELATQIVQFEPAAMLLAERSEGALYELRNRLPSEPSTVRHSVGSYLLDVRDRDAVEVLLRRVRPEIILHAAAHKHVPLGEENPREYLRNNCLATRWLAEAAAANGTERFVFISSDKAINPSSVMGASKRAAEIALLDLAHSVDTKLTIVRFGNVIGSSGSVVPRFMEQIAAGGPVTVTHPDVTRYFIRTSEAVSLVLQAATLGEIANILMLDMGDPVKIVDLARDLIRLSNHGEDEIPIVFTGLRAGEKLFEEIRLRGESLRPTVHPQIVVTGAPQPRRQEVSRWLAEADRCASDGRAVELLAELIEEATLDTRRTMANPCTSAELLAIAEAH